MCSLASTCGEFPTGRLTNAVLATGPITTLFPPMEAGMAGPLTRLEDIVDQVDGRLQRVRDPVPLAHQFCFQEPTLITGE